EVAGWRSLGKLRFSPGTEAPPLRAISRRRSGFMAAKPLRARGLPDSTVALGFTLLIERRRGQFEQNAGVRIVAMGHRRTCAGHEGSPRSGPGRGVVSE